MNKILMTFAVVMVIVLGVTACEKKTPSEKASDAARDAGQAARDAAQATGDALTEARDTAVKAAQEALNGLETKWHELQAKAAPATDEAKADLQKAKDEMAETLAEAKAKLVEAKDAGTDPTRAPLAQLLRSPIDQAGNRRTLRPSSITPSLPFSHLRAATLRHSAVPAASCGIFFGLGGQNALPRPIPLASQPHPRASWGILRGRLFP